MNSELTKKGNQLTLTRCIFNHIFDISLSYLIFNIIFILFILLVILMTSPENSCVFRGDSGYDDSKNISAKTSNPNTTRTISSEAYDFCGEPLIAQHLTLDFTPVQGLDSDAVARKVCSFWEFIHGTPSIQDLKMKPVSSLVHSVAWSHQHQRKMFQKNKLFVNKCVRVTLSC